MAGLVSETRRLAPNPPQRKEFACFPTIDSGYTAAPMLPTSYRAPNPMVIPDFRAHMENWKHYKLQTGRSPATSIRLYCFRFVAIASILVVITYFQRRNFSAGSKRLFFALLLIWLSGYFCAWLFIIAHQFRYFPIAASCIFTVYSVWQHNQFMTRIGLGISTVAIFTSIWAALELAVWNKELRASGLSSDRDIWDVIQFPRIQTDAGHV
jgi:hypothetical protein